MKGAVMTDKECVRSERIWRCACNYSPHFVAITADPIASSVADDPRVRGWFTIEVTDGPMRLPDRVRNAWKLLRSRGHQYVCGEVTLDPNTAREIRDHLSRFLAS